LPVGSPPPTPRQVRHSPTLRLLVSFDRDRAGAAEALLAVLRRGIGRQDHGPDDTPAADHRSEPVDAVPPESD
jgi:hypothetical protein